MRKLILIIKFFILLLISSASAQTINFNIQCKVINVEENKFAFLIIHSTPFTILKCSLENNIAEFKGSINLKDNLFFTASVLINKTDISSDEIEAKYKQLVFRPGHDKLRYIILENIKLEAENSDNMYTSKVIENGHLTLQFDEFRKAYVDPSYSLSFIKSHPNSPISLDFIPSFIKINSIIPDNRIDKKFDINAMYSVLSDSLKSTNRGKFVYNLIIKSNQAK